MSFDGIVTKSIVSQLREKLLGGKIEKIYQPEKEQLFLFIHSKGQKHTLFLSAQSNHSAIYITDNKPINPPEPGGFCMLLRKHLQGGRISELKQRGTERIIDIYVDNINEMGFNASKFLTVEIMGKHSNIILIDAETENIIDSIKRISADVNRYRQIFPGKKYIAPPSQEKFPLCTENINLSSGITSGKDLVSLYQGVSPQLAEEIINVNDSETDIAETLKNVIEISSSGNSGYVYLDDKGNPKEFHVYPLKDYESFYKTVTFDDPCRMAQYFFDNRETSNIVKQKTSDLLHCINNHLAKSRLKKQRLLTDIKKTENMDTHKLYGELLTAYMYKIDSGASSVELLNYNDNNLIKIPLDPLLSPGKNAQNYFKKYNKSKIAKVEKAKQLEETQKEIDYLESILDYTESAKDIVQVENLRSELIETGYLKRKKNSIKKAKQKQEPYKYITSDGFKVMAGHNNTENDFLTFKIAKNKDIWFHTKDIPGSHVILFTEGKSVTEQALSEAAALAALHSKGKDSENVPVDYTFVKYVKKPAGAKPGMVIFTNNKTLYVTPKELKEF